MIHWGFGERRDREGQDFTLSIFINYFLKEKKKDVFFFLCVSQTTLFTLQALVIFVWTSGCHFLTPLLCSLICVDAQRHKPQGFHAPCVHVNVKQINRKQPGRWVTADWPILVFREEARIHATLLIEYLGQMKTKKKHIWELIGVACLCKEIMGTLKRWQVIVFHFYHNGLALQQSYTVRIVFIIRHLAATLTKKLTPVTCSKGYQVIFKIVNDFLQKIMTK